MTTSLNLSINKLNLSFALIIFCTLSVVDFSNDDHDNQKHYQVIHGWPVLPENRILDEVSAVAVDSESNIFVLQRGGRKWPDNDILDQSPIEVPTIFVFEGATGNLLRKWGGKVFACSGKKR